MNTKEESTKFPKLIKYTTLPCEYEDGLCEILDFETSPTIIDAVAGVNITISKPGKFQEAIIVRNPDIIGCTVLLNFAVNGQEIFRVYRCKKTVRVCSK